MLVIFPSPSPSGISPSLEEMNNTPLSPPTFDVVSEMDGNGKIMSSIFLPKRNVPPCITIIFSLRSTEGSLPEREDTSNTFPLVLMTRWSLSTIISMERVSPALLALAERKSRTSETFPISRNRDGSMEGEVTFIPLSSISFLRRLPGTMQGSISSSPLSERES